MSKMKYTKLTKVIEKAFQIEQKESPNNDP